MSSRTVTANHRRRISPLAVVTTVCVIVLADSCDGWRSAGWAVMTARRATLVSLIVDELGAGINC